MSKFLKVMIALAVVAVMAVPAMAEMKLNGYYRLQMVSDNIANAGDKDAAAVNVVDQRLRMKLTNTLNDNVSFVYYAEIDTPWGQAGSTPSGSTETGGLNGADGVNLETKNVYLDVKIPDTMLSFRAGIQGFGVGKNYVVFGNDVAGLKVDAKVSDTLGLYGGWFKFYEDNVVKTDDQDVYVIGADLKLNDTAKLGADFLLFQDDNMDRDPGAYKGLGGAPGSTNYSDSSLYTLNVDGDFDLGMAALEAQAAYQFGSLNGKTGVQDQDYGGYMASAKVKANVGAAKLGLRLTYYSADDDVLDDETKVFIGNISNGVYEFAGENLHIFFTDKYYNNTNGGRRALTDAAYTGAGLFAITASADIKLGGGYDLKAGAGYFMANEDTFNGVKVFEDTDLGYEIGADFGRKLAEKVDVRLIGSYAGLGDFYKNNPLLSGSNDPDDIYIAKIVMNVSF